VTSGVYAIVNTITGQRYIGSTINFKVRSGSHRWALATGNLPNKPLRAAWAEYGSEVFRVEMLEETAADDDTLEATERKWIEHFVAVDMTLVYNVHLDGRRNTRPARPYWDRPKRARRPPEGAGEEA
jgi:group I intron endonuclease